MSTWYEHLREERVRNYYVGMGSSTAPHHHRYVTFDAV